MEVCIRAVENQGTGVWDRLRRKGWTSARLLTRQAELHARCRRNPSLHEHRPCAFRVPANDAYRRGRCPLFGNEAWNEDQVERPVAYDLIGNSGVAAFGVTGFWRCLRHCANSAERAAAQAASRSKLGRFTNCANEFAGLDPCPSRRFRAPRCLCKRARPSMPSRQAGYRRRLRSCAFLAQPRQRPSRQSPEKFLNREKRPWRVCADVMAKSPMKP